MRCFTAAAESEGLIPDHSQDTEQENNNVYIQLAHVAQILTEQQANYLHFEYLLVQR